MGDLLLVTGDSSSDRYAARLISYLQENGYEGTIFAAAGPESARAGAELVEDVVDHSVVGLTEVLGSLPFFFSLMSRLDSLLDKKPIHAVLMMDFPGFNMRFARRVRRKQIPLFYYITPQVWAWGRSRIKKLRDWFEQLFVIFPFEEDFFHQEGVNAQFVGHPLYEELRESETRDFYDWLDLEQDQEIISFFPGSRDHEIQRHLEPMAEVAVRLSRQSETVKPFLSAAPTVDQNQFREILTDEMMDILSLWNGQAHELLDNSTLAVLASGTVTMEATFTLTPMIMGYRTSWFTYWIGRLLLETRTFAMPNLISQDVKIPELIQGEFNVDQLFRTVENYLSNRVLMHEQKEELKRINQGFDRRNPEETVGQQILAYLN